MDNNDMETAAVVEQMENSAPVMEEQRENSALVYWNKFSANTRKALSEAVVEHWNVLNTEVGGDDFQEELSRLLIHRDMAKEQLEHSQQSGDERRVEISEESLNERQSALDDAYKSGTASAEMTTGMVGLFADLLPLCLKQSNIAGMSSLFREGMRFNVTTGEERTDVVPVKQSAGKQNSTKERVERTMERSTRPCDSIVVYEQGNDTPIKEIRRGDCGVSALVGVTIFLSDRDGTPHGCTLINGNYVMPDSEESLKDLPWVRSTNDVVSGQTHFVARLAASTGLIVEGYNSDDLEYRIVPLGEGKIRMVDSEGEPYRTKSLREDNKLMLVD